MGWLAGSYEVFPQALEEQIEAANPPNATRVVERILCRGKRACKVSGNGKGFDGGQAGRRMVKMEGRWGQETAEGRNGNAGWAGRMRRSEGAGVVRARRQTRRGSRVRGRESV